MSRVIVLQFGSGLVELTLPSSDIREGTYRPSIYLYPARVTDEGRKVLVF